jgi:predicted dehydrogenase
MPGDRRGNLNADFREQGTPLRFAIAGTGFWSRFQLAAWRELQGAVCVALYNRTRGKAEALAREFGVPSVYYDAEEMLRCEELDFLDIITDVATHSRFVHLAAERRLPVICQKPMATSLEEARLMVAACRSAGIPLFIHENWRWQTPIRRLKAELADGRIGAPFRAHIQYCTSFPVFDNQPFLKEIDQFILTDMGSHILDVARFLFGEAETLYCRTHRIHEDIRGEDVATVLLTMSGGATVTCDISYASRTEHERFPETYIFIEGTRGSLELGPDYWIRVTTAEGTHARRHPPSRYAWADPAYDLVHASIVPCNANLLKALQRRGEAETTGEDNLRTVRLVFASYESARTGQVVEIGSANRRADS